MPVFNNAKYPDTPADMAKYSDKELIRLFDGFWRSQATSNDMAFVNLAAKATTKSCHEVFEISDMHNGKCRITMSARDQKKILGKIGSRGYLGVDVRKMLGIVREMHQMVQDEVQAIALTKFYKHGDFAKYHRKNIFNSVKVNKQMAKVLQISDMNGLKQFQFHLQMGENAEAEKLMNTLAQAEEMKKNASSVVKKLMRQNHL